MRFSVCTAANHVRLLRDQSAASTRGGSSGVRLWAISGARPMSSTRRRTPAMLPSRNSFAASVTSVNASDESYS